MASTPSPVPSQVSPAPCCQHPSLPASLPASPAGCSMPQHAQHCPAPCKQQPGHCRAPHPSCSHLQRGFTSTSPSSRGGCRTCWGTGIGCVRTWIRDVSGHGCRMNRRAESSTPGLDQTPQWLIVGRKASPNHGHHSPACGLGLWRAWSSLRLSPVTFGTPRRLLPPTRYSMQPPAPWGLRAGQGLPWGLQREVAG